jgi:dephospho-CoA kinase
MNSAFFSIGITGGIACGKSEVGRIFQSAGIAVCDADFVAHDLMKQGTRLYGAVVAAFGDQIVAADGSLDRAALGSIVFEDAAALQKLNELVHPAVCESIREWIASQEGSCAVMVPLLYEVGLESMFDVVVCVAASHENMLTRLETRGFSKEEGVCRIEAQMELKEKISRADHVIYNNGTLAELRESTLRVVDRIKCERMQ